jgi:hypothetical protein
MEIAEKTVFPNISQPLSGLEDLAENLWWSWHPAARMLFKMLDGQSLWRACPPSCVEDLAPMTLLYCGFQLFNSGNTVP